MSGTAKVKPPKNDAEWARNTQKRIEKVENPTAGRFGEWVLSTHAETGNLIASHVDGGSVILATKPAASASPDEVADNTVPYIKVERQQTQSESRGATHLVIWDTVVSQTRDWGFSAPGTDIDVPVNGVFQIMYHMARTEFSALTTKAIVFINGEVKMAQEFNPQFDEGWYIAMYMAETFTLNSGDIISCGVYVEGSGTSAFGSPDADPSVHTSLSIQLISKEEG